MQMNGWRAGARCHQRGHETLGFLIVAILITMWPVLLAFVVSLIVPFFLRKLSWGRRLIWWGATVVFWALVVFFMIVVPGQRSEEARQEQRRFWASVEAKRKHQILSVPDRIEARSVRFENVVIRPEWVYQLLAERGLDFVDLPAEVLAAEQGKPARLKFSFGEVDVANAGERFVRLRIGVAGSPECLPEQRYYHHYLPVPPLLPNSCLLVRPVGDPADDLRVIHEPGNSENKPYVEGRVRLERAPVGERLGELATTFPNPYGDDERLNRDGEPPPHRCCGPLMMLLNRVHGADANWRDRQPQVVSVQDVAITAEELAKIKPSESLAVVKPRAVEVRVWGSTAAQQMFVADIGDSKLNWPQFETALASVSTVGIGEDLVDLQRKLVLRGSAPHVPGGRWAVRAIDDGFLLFRVPDIARFSRGGQFQWAVRLVPPEGQELPKSINEWNVRGLRIDRGDLVLPAQSKQFDTGSRGEYTLWRIALRDLPGMQTAKGELPLLPSED